MILSLLLISASCLFTLPTQYSSDGFCSCYPPSDCLISYCVVFSSIFNGDVLLRGTSYVVSNQEVGNVVVKTTLIVQDDAAKIKSMNGDLLTKIIITNYSNSSSGYVSQMELSIKDAENVPDSGTDDIIKFGYSIKFFLLMDMLGGAQMEINIVNDKTLQLNYTLNEKGNGMKYEQNEEAGYYISFPYTGKGLNGDEMNDPSTTESSSSSDTFSDSETENSTTEGIDTETGMSLVVVLIVIVVIGLVVYLLTSGKKDKVDKNTELLKSPPMVYPNEDYF
eukprot:GAHX01000487.1.p1 GENE.GAHX01000487.1~~GAHX01000487.1.p1  ORF type:complete len:279 (-),score=42.89 GAHX01000487.1:31-867(-)